MISERAKRIDWEQIKKLAQESGFAVDSQRIQILQEIFDPAKRERLTVIQNAKVLLHLNYLKHLAILLGEKYGAFIRSLYESEIDLSMSMKGVSLEKFTTILEAQQNASEITVKSETIPQAVTEKKGLLSRLFGGESNE